MSGFFTFSFSRWSADLGRQCRYGVVFCSKENVTQSLLSDRTHSFLQSAISPDRLLLITQSFTKEPLVGFLETEELLQRLPGRLRIQNPLPITCAYFDPSGRILELKGTNDPPLKELSAALKRDGLLEIFNRRQGLLPRSPLYHYVKPSRMHAAQFIRTAQILIDGGEVDFIASCLLPHLLTSTEYIYCDSASISVVAYALAKLKKSHDPQFGCPVVESFGSYEHVDDYPFLNPSDSLFLISASTSGDLAHRLIKKKSIPSNRIVTLFYLGERPTSGELLLDLTYHQKRNPKGYESIEGFEPEDCPHCRQESSQIHLIGDQFLPESPRVEAVKLTKNDPPEWLGSFLKKTEAKGVIRCHHARGLRQRVHEQFFDIGPVLKKAVPGDQSFSENIKKSVIQSVPASLSRIIFINDSISRKLALFIRNQFLKFNRRRKVSIVNARTVISAPDRFMSSSGTVVVVAGCVLTGRSLMELSQVLRNIQKNGSIVFFIGLARCETEAIYQEIRTNVTINRDRARNFAFQCVEKINVPNSTSFRDSIWSDEIAFLRRLKVRFAGDAHFPLKLVNKRIAYLTRGAVADSGINTDLFWPDSRGKPLRLRPNFSFFDFNKPAVATHAEIFFVINSLLHKLRNVRPGSRSLSQSEHHRAIIHPNSFYQFNDGVVQCALLRAARKAEIDYRVNQEQSGTMREVLNSIFLAWNRPVGEAAVEFLLMVAMEHLQVLEADKRAVVSDFRDRLPQYSFGRYLCRFILRPAT